MTETILFQEGSTSLLSCQDTTMEGLEYAKLPSRGATWTGSSGSTITMRMGLISETLSVGMKEKDTVAALVDIAAAEIETWWRMSMGSE